MSKQARPRNGYVGSPRAQRLSRQAPLRRFWSHLKALGAGLQTQPPLNRSPGPILDPQNHQIPSRTQLATDCVGILVGKTWDPAHRFGGKLCLVLGSRTGPLKLHGSYCKLDKWAQIWAQNIGPNLAPRNSKYSVPFCSPWATIVGCHLGLPGILLFRRPKP